VDHLLLKGFSYMKDLYGSAVARKVGDIDLLVREEDEAGIRRYLLSEGYEACVDPEFRGSPEQFFEASALYGEAHYKKKSGALTAHIDLHWRMQANFAGYPLNETVALERFPWWEHTGSVEIGNASAVRLSPEMQFIHMAVHFAAHHQFCGIRWFMELCLFIKRFGPGLDWDFIFETASSPDCRKMLGVCLKLVSDYMGSSWPCSETWRRFLPAGVMLPAEYRFYRSCLLRDSRSMLAVYVCLSLSPATVRGRLKMIAYFLFDPDSVIFWRVSGAPASRWLQPFYILFRVAGRIFAGRRR
jgi:hypothetical protein